MHRWYLVHTKIRQEQKALEHLERQGYSCFLPTILSEKVRRGRLSTEPEPLFPRYLFIRLSSDTQSPGWGPIRSTQGVSRLVTFGHTPASVPDALVDALQMRCAEATEPLRQFQPGDSVQVRHGAFQGVDAIFQQATGEGRVVVLLTLMSQDVRLEVPASAVRATG